MLQICEINRDFDRRTCSCRQGSASRARRGVTLLEITVASGILVILLSGAIQMLRAVSSQQRAGDRQADALQAVQVVSEEIGNLPWEGLTSESAAQVGIPSRLERRLRGAKLAVTVAEQAGPIPTKRVLVELTWPGADGRPAGRARLTTWVFPES
jgi:prepilin-type N-terminal cleavage/methylation domain-containing protein